MSYTPPNVGDKVRVTLEGYVYGAASNGLSLTASPTDGTNRPTDKVEMMWPWNSSVSFSPTVEVIEAAYVPQPGDLASWRSEGVAVPTSVVFLRMHDGHTGCWYMTGHGTLISLPSVDITSERFQLLVSGGKPVSQPTKPEPTPDRQAVLDDYHPKIGDVGIYKTSSGSPVTVSYRRNDRYPNNTCGWYQANGVESKGAHLSPSFQLVLRDGILQEGVNV